VSPGMDSRNLRTSLNPGAAHFATISPQGEKEEELPTITLSSEVKRQVTLLARAWETSEGRAIERLLDRFQSNGAQKNQAGNGEASPGVRVHAVYRGVRIEGVFDPDTKGLVIIRGPMTGRVFDSPSGAATGVVQSINPKVRPNRNGWGFWTITASGELLQSIR
jgi:hypothetical protein